MAEFILYRDASRGFRWRFKAANGQIIADSGESYVAKQGAIDGINFVKQHAASSNIVDIS